MSIRIATYNILATAYIRPDWYVGVPDHLLNPAWRIPALIQHIENLDADILCLQEVEPRVFEFFQQHLQSIDYRGLYDQKGQGKPEGFAIFFLTNRFQFHEHQRLEYQDEERGPGQHSGFVAQLLILNQAGQQLLVVNTHIRWDPSSKPLENQMGRLQILELMGACETLARSGCEVVICGDFNRTPQNPAIRTLQEAGYRFAHDGLPDIHSNLANGRAQLVDYLFCTDGLKVFPLTPPVLTTDSILPSKKQPSDHLALVGDFKWEK